MTREEQKIIDSYLVFKFSEQQIADKLLLGYERVRWVLKKYKVQKRSISEAVRYLHITKFKKKEFVLNTALTPEQEKLKIAGIMLYWGEGAKKGTNVAFANSDPVMITLFLRFLRKVCGIDEHRLHATLHHYPDLNEQKLRRFWSKTLDIPLKQFYRSYVHVNTKGSYKKKSIYGTLSVQYSDTKLLAQINAWIVEYSTIGVRRGSSVGRALVL